MADKVQFELVSPERVLASEAVDMVVVPGSEGDFGVLPGHSPLMSLLRPGVISIYQGTSVTRRIFVAGGLAEANPTGVIVLAESAEPVEELDAPRARQQLTEAEAAFAQARDLPEAERTRHEVVIEIARARVEVFAGS